MKTYRGLLATLALLMSLVYMATAQTGNKSGQWYVSPGAGVIVFENSQPAHPGALGMLRIGYNVSADVSVEASGLYGPRFHKNTRRYDVDFSPAEAWGLAGDVLFHLRSSQEVSPYVSVGAMYMRSPDGMFVRCNNHLYAPRVGGGILWRLSKNIDLRANANAAFSFYQRRMEFAPVFDVGMNYRFGG